VDYGVVFDEFDYSVAMGQIKSLIRSGVDLETGMAALFDYGDSLRYGASLRPSSIWEGLRSLDFRADAERLRLRLVRDIENGSLGSEVCVLRFFYGLFWPKGMEPGPNGVTEDTPEPSSCLGVTGQLSSEDNKFRHIYQSEIIETAAVQAVRIIADVRDLDTGPVDADLPIGRSIHDFVVNGFLGLTLAEWCRSSEGRQLLLGGAKEREIRVEDTYNRLNLGRITAEAFHPDPETSDPRFWKGFGQVESACASLLIRLSLAEDLGLEAEQVNSTILPYCIHGPTEYAHLIQLKPGDMTGEAVIPEDAKGVATVVARSSGVVAGGPILSLLADLLQIEYLPLIADGEKVWPGDRIAKISGDMHKLLVMERTALNFLQRLSGIASTTARFVAEVAGTKAVILDTRKTTPGWRPLEKYAVRCGGGTNHRFGLYDAILIKDNHLAWLGDGGDPIGRAVEAARAGAPKGIKFIEVEVDTLEQLDRALEVKPDIILVDNLGPEKLAEAVRRRNERAPEILLEASGGVTLTTVRALAETGVDRISVGALTHSAPALDIGLDFDRVIVS
jgi:nicotinate-nucleotide pyrophosphorylase (carboxylating)